MSTQNTTLPPLPHPLLIAGGKNWFTIEQMHAYARAAIAAQAQQPMPSKLPIPDQSSIDIEFSCGHTLGYAEGWNAAIDAVNQPSAVKESLTPQQALNDLVDESERLGLYGGAQQAQGVPAGAIACMDTFRPVRLEFGVTMHRDVKPHESGWLRRQDVLDAMLAAAPQAEPELEREPQPSRPQCRDCADFGPICPNSGLPCGGIGTKGGDK